MATTATQLQDAIYIASQNDYFQKNENRKIVMGAFESAWAARNKLFPAKTLENLKKSSRQPTKIDVFQKRANGEATARACSGTGGASTARYTLSFQGFTEDFSLSDLEFYDNDFERKEAFAHNLMDRIRSLDERIEAAAVAYLDAQYTAGNGSIFTNFNDAKQVPLSNYDLASNRAAMWLNKAKSEMLQNRYSGPLQLVGDPVMASVAMAMLNQGAGNAINSNFQFNGVDMMFSNGISNNTGIYATAYLFEQGMFGVLTWINQIHRNGRTIGGPEGSDVWTRMAHPKYGYEIELKIKRACTDNSSTITGGEADYVESLVLHVDVAFVHAYSSDSNSGLYKYELNDDESVQSGSGSYV